MLRIKDWHENFETERTSTFNRRQQIDIQTDTTDMNLIWLLTDHKNGAAHFAVWIMLCELHAFTTKPREGWLSHNGKEGGIPLLAKDLALQIHISENIIIEALERLSSPKIGWLEEIPVERSVCAAQEQLINSGQAASLIPSHPTPPNPISPKRARREYPAEFERLWKIHSKGGKDAAYRAMKKLDPDQQELDRWMEKLEAYKKSEQWRRAVSPNMSTWINQGYFDGEIFKEEDPSEQRARWRRERESKPTD